MKRDRTIKVVLLKSFRNGGGIRFEKGEILNLQISNLGHNVLFDDTRVIAKVPASYFQII
ncbi:hypothetical protein [uncultured Duncaniella sp.]|uniref:hypothetical protein n=1 Tax=uncultured Duncaniella sp. TaxID=2768039 RepID=UPI0026F385D2|nr:hypothetical protein [uncultured Duncaniella sp.]